MKIHLLLTIILTTFYLSLSAQEKTPAQLDDLAKKAQNPVAAMVSLPLADYNWFDFGPDHNVLTSLQFKPVVPSPFLKHVNLIFRSIIPVAIVPAPLNKAGLGDVELQVFLVPESKTRFIWGAGPYLTFPTGIPTELTSGKWTAGPIAVGLFTTPKMVFGILVSNRWSYAGSNTEADINQFYICPFLNYNFKHGWALTTSPEIYANWNKPAAEVWTIPIGAGVLKTFLAGKQLMSANIGYYYHIVAPAETGSGYIKAGFSLMFPVGRK
ncbi:MAG: hypothetical protein NT040_19305 [Bacteroidetes bacterium]|nr:hypothetical protein [Bacteroidota bacterium]